MAKIRNYREGSRAYKDPEEEMAYKDLEEEMAFERGQLKTSVPVWTSTNEDEDEDLPLDLSSSSSKWSAVQEEVEDGGDGSSERDSNSSSCNESTPSDGSVSPPAQEVPSRPDLSSSKKKKGLAKGARWMMREGITAYISHEDVVDSDLKELKQTLEGLVRAKNLTEAQSAELMNIRKSGKNTNTARNSRSRKEAEVGNLRRAVETAEQLRNQKRKEKKDLVAELRHWEGKLAALSRDLMLSCKRNPEEYQVVVEGDEVRFALRQDLKVVGLGYRT